MTMMKMVMMIKCIVDRSMEFQECTKLFKSLSNDTNNIVILDNYNFLRDFINQEMEYTFN